MIRRQVKVTLREDAFLLLRRLSEASNESMSSIMASFLELNRPDVERLADLFCEAKKLRVDLPSSSQISFKSLCQLTDHFLHPNNNQSSLGGEL